MKVKYITIYQGDQWVLSDNDWRALEMNGWKVDWRNKRYFNALAISATKEFDSLEDAEKDFYGITGEFQRDNWNSCEDCKSPHNFVVEES